MNEDCLKLTSYFGERDRTQDGLLADGLLELFGAHGVRASALLRGCEGFGRLHHLHTDRLLTLSEDLPVVSTAVDTRERIGALLEAVGQMQRRGLITLERVRLLSGEIEPVTLPQRWGESAKLTVYVGRHERVGENPAFLAVCDLLHRHGIAGATVLLGVDGTRNGRRQRARFIGRNANVPSVIIAVGSGERIAGVMPEVGDMLREPLLELARVRVCKRDGELLATVHEPLPTGEHGPRAWQKLTVYSSQAHIHEGHPINLQIIRRLRESDAAGATCIRGTWGFHGDHAPRGDKFFQLRRHVPVITVVIDTPERIAEAFKVVDSLTGEHGLVTSEMVPAMTAMSETERHGTLRLADHGL